MKKLLTLLLAAAFALSLCACGSDNSLVPSGNGVSSQQASGDGAIEQGTADVVITEPPKGNQSSFSLDKESLSKLIAGSWVNQVDFNDKLQFADDLSFVHFVGADKHSGTAELTESNGWLTLSYSDGYSPERSYIWVDNPANVNGNTWYVNGSTFAYGGKTYIKDLVL